MEEAPGEPVEAEPEEEEVSEAPPRKGRRTLIVIVAVVVVLALVGGIVVLLFFSNAPPVPSFTASSVDLRLIVNAEATSDPNGDAIGSYAWNFGDGGVASGPTLVATTHTYTAVGTYNVTLTAVDSRGAGASTSKVVQIQILPTPYFIARQAGMTTTLDASGSTAQPGRTISSYQWDFGDGNTDMGVVTTHVYQTANRYKVTLTVTDSNGTYNAVSRYVSANTTTVDILADRFFVANCPFGDFWSLRFHTYGDVILQDPNGHWGSIHGPCVDYYPWVLYSSAQPDVNPSWVYSLFHMDMRATHNLGYNVRDPVVLPIFNASVAPAPDSYIFYNFTFQYLDNSSISFWQSYSQGGLQWPVNSKYSDGFGYLVQGNITMDLTESKRIFGVVANTPAEAQAWWNANTKPGGAPPLVGVENQFGVWLDDLGNGKYDIYNAFQWFYESDIVDLNATVNPTTGQTQIRTFFDGWGFDVLMDRWFYWGNVSYKDAVNAPYGQYKPRGWMPFETCWCENATVNLAIGSTALDAHLSATSEYWFGAVGDPGADGAYGTSDDLPGWGFAPTLMDYMPPLGSGQPGASEYPNSELKWYVGQSQVISTPGSYAYGQYYEYMTVPNRWNTSLGNTLTLVMPRTEIPWYNPAKSTWNSVTHIGNYAEFNSSLTFRSVTPAGNYYIWDERGKVLSLAWPAGFSWGQSGLPLDSAPAIEFAPETLG